MKRIKSRIATCACAVAVLIWICALVVVTTVSGRPQTQPSGSAAGQEELTVAKDSIQVTAFTFNIYRGNYDVWSWVPLIDFRINGPIESGSQLYAEFTQPGGGP